MSGDDAVKKSLVSRIRTLKDLSPPEIPDMSEIHEQPRKFIERYLAIRNFHGSLKEEIRTIQKMTEQLSSSKTPLPLNAGDVYYLLELAKMVDDMRIAELGFRNHFERLRLEHPGDY